MMRIQIALLLVACLLAPAAFAQNKSYQDKLNENEEQSNSLPEGLQGSYAWRLQFNAFVGPDAERMKVTPQGLGSISGLLLVDNFVFGKPWNLTKSKGFSDLFLILRSGFLTKKWRFADNLNFTDSTNDDVPEIFDDAERNPNHEFSNTFFGHDKSKLRAIYFRVAPELGLTFGSEKWPFIVSAGPIADILLGAKHKLKFEENGDNQKSETSNGVINMNPLQFGLAGTIGTRYVTFSGGLMLSQFFNDSRALDVHAIEFGIAINWGAKKQDKVLPTDGGSNDQSQPAYQKSEVRLWH